MKLTVKKLQGGECCVEWLGILYRQGVAPSHKVLPTTSISEIKREVAGKLSIPVEEQKLLLLGRTLADEQTIDSYPTIKDGTKLNLVVKKPDGLLEASMKYFKKLGMTDKEATNAANKLLKIVQDKFNKLSWDDIDRLSMNCLIEECGQSRPVVENEMENEDMYGL